MKHLAGLTFLLSSLIVGPVAALASDCPCGPVCTCGPDCPCPGCSGSHQH